MFLHAMKFDLPEEIDAIRDVAHRWAQERLKPMAQEIDAQNAFPNALWREMGDLGLLGVTVDEAYGGAQAVWSALGGFSAHAGQDR